MAYSFHWRTTTLKGVVLLVLVYSDQDLPSQGQSDNQEGRMKENFVYFAVFHLIQSAHTQDQETDLPRNTYCQYNCY